VWNIPWPTKTIHHASGSANHQAKPSRANLIQGLKQDVGPEALRTLNPERAASQRLEPEVGSSTCNLGSYPCITQKPPPAIFASNTSIASLQVRIGDNIPRWKANTTINFAALEQG
jgi:hypothetical protein